MSKLIDISRNKNLQRKLLKFSEDVAFVMAEDEQLTPEQTPSAELHR